MSVLLGITEKQICCTRCILRSNSRKILKVIVGLQLLKKSYQLKILGKLTRGQMLCSKCLSKIIFQTHFLSTWLLNFVLYGTGKVVVRVWAQGVTVQPKNMSLKFA